MSEPRLFGIKEAARLLSVSSWSIRRWIRQRKIRSVRLGRRVLVPSSEVDRLSGNAPDVDL
jgi:excisionase family DNA binding protein